MLSETFLRVKGPRTSPTPTLQVPALWLDTVYGPWWVEKGLAVAVPAGSWLLSLFPFNYLQSAARPPGPSWRPEALRLANPRVEGQCMK